MLLLILAQAAAAQAPDIELNANVRIRSLTIEKQGDARLTITTELDGGNVVDVQAPKANGRKTLQNVEVKVRGEARIADPAEPKANNQESTETATPQ